MKFCIQSKRPTFMSLSATESPVISCEQERSALQPILMRNVYLNIHMQYIKALKNEMPIRLLKPSS
jgi:hypothetical protein